MKKFYSFFIVFSILVLTSCAPTQTIVDTSCPGYKSIDFNRADISMKKIGIMPVLGGNEKEQYRRPMGDALTKHMGNEFQTVNVKSPNEVIATINNSGLSDDYSRALNNYSTTGIVPREMVEKLGGALSVQYLLYTRLLAETEFGEISLGSSTSLIAMDEVYVQCQIWDTKIGDVVWEGKGGVAKTKNNSSDMIEKTAEGLSKVIGNEKFNGPCEDRAALLTSAQSSASAGYIILLVIGLALLL